MVKEVSKSLSGKKTYTVGLAMIAYAVAGMVLGYTDANDAIEMLLQGLGVIALRLGVRKAEL